MKKIIAALAVIGLTISAQAGNFTNAPLPKLKVTLGGINRLAWSVSEETDDAGASAHSIVKYSIPACPTNNVPTGVKNKTWDSNVNISFEVTVSAAEIASAPGTNNTIKTKRALNKKEDEIAAWLKAELP